MSAGFISFAQCWSCQFGQCFERTTPHTWMDDDDLDYHTDAERLRSLTKEDLAAEQPCACRCAGGKGGCRPITTTTDASSAPVQGPGAGPGKPKEQQR